MLNEFNPDEIEVPRSITKHAERVESTVLHGFGDASKQRISAAVYVIINQNLERNAGLLVAKSRLAKKKLSISKIELIAGHLVAIMFESTTTALQVCSFLDVIHGWIAPSLCIG